jgi:NAD(P)-dependent dehydrogenase (short-subunit alcohol dehydrogenase family)
MRLDQSAQTALVTGAASGMGQGAALVLAAHGLKVLAADLDQAGLEKTVGRIKASGGWAEALTVDISQSDSVADMFARAAALVQRLDVLVHAAAVMGKTANLEDIEDQDWKKLLAVNLDGTFYCCREAVRWMKQTGGGRIILFSSVAALQPTPGAIAYSAAKGGVNTLARSLAVESARHNIRVNVIAPGYIDTPMLAELPDGFENHILKKTPLRRLGRVEEITGLVSFLISPEADFFTGQVFSPNGGLVI